MDGLLIALMASNFVLFGGLAAAAAGRARREQVPSLRSLSWVLAATALAFALGAVQRIALHAVRLGWIDVAVGEFIIHEWQLLASVAAGALGVAAIVAWRRLWRSLSDGAAVAKVLASGLPAELVLDECGLTNREQEVVAAIGDGCVSDADLAERLFISQSTARTHVRNILRKTGLQNRRELMVLASPHLDRRTRWEVRGILAPSRRIGRPR